MPDPFNSKANLLSHRHHFQYIAAPSVFGTVRRNQAVDSTIIAAVRVVFENVRKYQKKKFNQILFKSILTLDFFLKTKIAPWSKQ